MRTENFKLRKEDELLLYCARTKVDTVVKERIISLINEDFDWKHLIDMASRHRLRPLLFYNLNSICPEYVPDGVLLNLKDYYFKNSKKNLLFYGEMLKILKLFNFEEIYGIPYKGPLLAIKIYGNLTLRQFGDIDILIDKNDVLKSKKVLLDNGYIPLFNFDNSTDILLKYYRDYVFINKSNNIVVELHWKFSPLDFSFSRGFSELFEMTEELTLNGNKILNLENESLILILSIHNAHHYWNRLNWICDLSELIESTNKINWNKIIVKSKEIGANRILLINVFLINELFGLKLPDEILEEISSDKSVEIISRKIMSNIFSDRNYPGNFIEELIFKIRMRENYRNKIYDFINPFLIPTPLEVEKVPLPLILFPLYYMIRVMRLLGL